MCSLGNYFDGTTIILPPLFGIVVMEHIHTKNTVEQKMREINQFHENIVIVR